MSIKSKVKDIELEDPNTDYPILRKWIAHRNPTDQELYGDLVVLFIDSSSGVPLSGVAPERIGRCEEWGNVDSPSKWAPTKIKLSSLN